VKAQWRDYCPDVTDVSSHRCFWSGAQLQQPPEHVANLQQQQQQQQQWWLWQRLRRFQAKIALIPVSLLL
jgi:hypothetical protein